MRTRTRTYTRTRTHTDTRVMTFDAGRFLILCVLRLVLQATLAAANVAAVLSGFPVWPRPDNISPFIEKPVNLIPQAAPSIVNQKDLNLKIAADA